MPAPSQRDFALEPADTERLANLAGPFDAHLRLIELRLGVEIANRGNVFRVTGAAMRSPTPNACCASSTTKPVRKPWTNTPSMCASARMSRMRPRLRPITCRRTSR